jgi:hypothetical protein
MRWQTKENRWKNDRSLPLNLIRKPRITLKELSLIHAWIIFVCLLKSRAEDPQFQEFYVVSCSERLIYVSTHSANRWFIVL